MKEIKRILVPIDFSPPARRALRYATRLAERCRARLVLLHVAELPGHLTSSFAEEVVQNEREHMAEAERMLNALVPDEERRGVDLRILVKSGNAADEILSTASEEKTDLMIMGTHGHGFLGRCRLGSVSRKILRRVDIPTITVQYPASAYEFARILYATDLSAPSRRGLRSALELAQIMHSHLTALHAVNVGIEGGAEAAEYLGDERLHEARARLEALRAGAPATFDVEAVSAEDSVIGTILKTAAKESAGLIAMSLCTDEDHNVAEGIICEAPVPVLFIPVRVKATGEPLAA